MSNRDRVMRVLHNWRVFAHHMESTEKLGDKELEVKMAKAVSAAQEVVDHIESRMEVPMSWSSALPKGSDAVFHIEMELPPIDPDAIQRQLERR